MNLTITIPEEVAQVLGSGREEDWLRDSKNSNGGAVPEAGLHLAPTRRVFYFPL